MEPTSKPNLEKDAPTKTEELSAPVESSTRSVEPRMNQNVPLEATDEQIRRGNQPGVLVLQWLTYAFWLWFAGSMVWLVGVTIAFFISNDPDSIGMREVGAELAYPLAATIIMLIVALVCDVIYSRFESPRKRGGSAIIMLIHAVLFGLATVASMVTALFATIMMLVSSDPVDVDEAAKVTIMTALVIMLLFAAMFVRTLFVDRIRHVRRIFWGIVTVAAVGFVVACFAGPVMYANVTKDDRLIEEALPTLASDISQYAQKHNKLPEKLSDVTSSDSYSRKKVQAMLDRRLVTYKPNTAQKKETPGKSVVDPGSKKLELDAMVYPTPPDYEQRPTYFYQLCVTYKTERNQDRPYTYTEQDTVGSGVSVDSLDASYPSYPSTYSHKKGEVCYDLGTDQAYFSPAYFDIGSGNIAE